MKTIIYIFGLIILASGIFSCDSEIPKAEYKPKTAQEITDSIATDSLDHVKQLEIVKADSLAQVKWYKSKAGKIQKKHPEWSKEDCQLIADNKFWIGMSLDMLKYERGTPNHANPSNYGNGVQWQWCWDDYTPSCFYGEDDGIIKSYN